MTTHRQGSPLGAGFSKRNYNNKTMADFDKSMNAPENETDNADFNGWVPFGIQWESVDPKIEWCYIGQNRFTDPFFGQTIDRQRQRLGNRKGYRITSLKAFDNFPVVSPPAGFIFHTSRCGSTLVAQIVASVPRFTVISEAVILSSIIRPPAQFFADDHEFQTRLLRSVVNALAQPRAGQETPCFIKFGSGSVLDLPIIQRAFPDVPWVFLYREPIEVLSALLQIRSDVLPPGLIKSGMLNDDIETVRAMQPAEFWARVLARRYKAALQAFEPAKARLINYKQLPSIIWMSLLRDFGVACTNEEILLMQTASRFNAKEPTKIFVDDTDRKQNMATNDSCAIVDKLLRPDYEQLESIRLSVGI